MSNCLSKEMVDVTETNVAVVNIDVVKPTNEDAAVNTEAAKYDCGKCDKAYSSKKSLCRHKRQKHSKMEEVKTAESMKERGVQSPVHFNQNEMSEEEVKQLMETLPEDGEMYIPTVIDTEMVYKLGDDCYLRQNQTSPFVLLQKKKIKFKLNYGELCDIMELLDTISEKVREYISGNKVVYQQKLKSSTTHVSVNTPYCCVDIREFWLIPGTGQMAASRNGVALTFSEFEHLKHLLLFLNVTRGSEPVHMKTMMTFRTCE